MTPRGRLGLAAAAAVPVAFLTATYGWPLVAISRRALSDAGWRVVSDTLADPRMARIAAVTVAQAAVSTVVSLAVGVPAAWVHARLRFPLRRTVWVASAVPFVLPTVVVSAGFLAATGPDGFGDSSTARWALVIVAHVAVNVGVVVRTVGARIAAVPVALEATARSLGRGPLAAAWTVGVRGALDAVRGVALVVFLFCLTSFGIVVVLGGGTATTVEVEIWYYATRLFRLDAAAVLALAQLAVVVVGLAIYERGRRRRVVPAGVVVHRRRPECRAERVLVGVTAVALVLLAGIPLGALAVRSLRVGDHWGLDHYRALLEPLAPVTAAAPIAAVGRSMVIALVAAAVTMAVAVPATIAARRAGVAARLLDLGLMLPLATSAATVGFGILVAYRTPPFDLRGSWWAVPLAEATIAVPLVVRVLLPVADAVDPRGLEAAASLGAGPARRWWRLVFPVVRPGLGVGAGLAFAVSLGEFGAVSFLARPDGPTVPQVIARLVGRVGDANFGQAMALGCVLAVLTGGVFAALEALGRGRALEF